MNLIIVFGPEATGKTAVGKKAAELLKYKYIGKDVIKETLFNVESLSTWKFFLTLTKTLYNPIQI